MDFVDCSTCKSIGVSVPESDCQYGMGPMRPPNEFFGRPQKINGTVISITGAPFYYDQFGTTNTELIPLYFGLPQVTTATELQLSQFFRATLRVRFEVASNPFMYGALWIGFWPFPEYDASYKNITGANATAVPTITPLTQAGAIAAGNYTSPAGLTLISQLKSVQAIDVSRPQTVEFAIELAGANGWLPTNSAALSITGEVAKVGRFFVMSPTGVRSASTNTNGPSVTPYVWLEDVQLSGMKQQSSEPSEGVSMSGMVNGAIPYLTKAATALKLLGYSRPITQDKTTRIVETNVDNTANGDRGEAITRLALTSATYKEASWPSAHDLDISKIVDRWCYIGQAALAVNSFTAPCWFRVKPMYYSWLVYWNSLSSVEKYAVALSPTAHVGQLFRYWTGSMKYKVDVYGPATMSGRLRVKYSPNYTIDTTETNGQSSYTQNVVIDLCSTRSFEFEVNWQQGVSVLRTDDAITNVYTSTPSSNFTTSAAYTTIDPYSNGTIAIEVEQKMFLPMVTSASVSLVVYAKGGEDLCFFDPDATRLSPYAAMTGGSFVFQSEQVAKSVTSFGMKQSILPFVKKGCYGLEPVRNLNLLMKRYSDYRSELLRVDNASVASTVESLVRFDSVYPAYPVLPGPQPSTNYAFDLTAGSTSFNYVSWSPMTWLAPAFFSRGGSVRYKFLIAPLSIAPLTNTDLVAVHQPFNRYVSSAYLMRDSINTLTTLWNHVSTHEVGISGRATTPYACSVSDPNKCFSGETQANARGHIEIEVPDRTFTRFQFARCATPGGFVYDGSEWETFGVSTYAELPPMVVDTTEHLFQSQTFVRVLVAAGEDFYLREYISAPVYIVSTTVPFPGT